MSSRCYVWGLQPAINWCTAFYIRTWTYLPLAGTPLVQGGSRAAFCLPLGHLIYRGALEYPANPWLIPSVPGLPYEGRGALSPLRPDPTNSAQYLATCLLTRRRVPRFLIPLFLWWEIFYAGPESLLIGFSTLYHDVSRMNQDFSFK